MLIAHTDPKSPISEAYRVLRTNIQFSSVDNPLRAIVVTSAGPGEGKSTTIANLAITLAQSGSRVLIIDADLRKPKIHKLFGFSNQAGMVNVLAQREDYTKFLRKPPEDNLHVLTSGPIPPNPSELLSSNSMKQFTDKVKEDYDLVLFDAPPIGAVTDAAILSTIVDGTMLVVASAQVHIDALQSAKELLEKVNANILGVVLNKMDRNSQGNYYYYEYSYYGEDDSKKGNKRLKKKPKRDE